MQSKNFAVRNRRLGCLPGVVALICGLTLAAPIGLQGQVDTGAILGTVKDPSGAVIPGATVTLISKETGLSLVTTTDPSGRYIFTPVRIGAYRVLVKARGFEVATRVNVTVNIQQQVVANFTLHPGAVTQTVTVTAAPPALETQSASVGQVISGRTINDLPLNGRNYTFLAQLTSGVTQGQETGRGLDASGSFAANGNRPTQNNYMLDGIDNNSNLFDFLNGTSFVIRPPIDALAEFKVQTANYSAEFGGGGGAVLNATIKSGTNELHGDAWEFLRNDAFDAADFFENAGNTRKGEYRQNQFGFTLGGPVLIPRVYNGRNKTFFFIDYAGTRIRQATPFLTAVPTLAERDSGYTDFSDLISNQSGTIGPDLLGRSVPLGTIFDPATTRSVSCGVNDPVTGLAGPVCPAGTPAGTVMGYARDPFPGNIIPASRLDPNAIKLLDLLPLPNGPGIFTNYTTNPVRQETVDQFDARIDQNFSDRDQMFGRVSYSDEVQLKPGPFATVLDGGGFNQGNETDSARNGALSWTHTFSPTIVNEARAGFSYIQVDRLQPFANNLSNIPGQFGIQGVPQVPQNGGLPTIVIGGLAELGGSSFLPSDEVNSTLQLTENLTKVYGSHTFKGGFEYQHLKISFFQPAWSRGQFNFDGNYTSIPTMPDGSTGKAQLLITPVDATVPGGVNLVGGADSVLASNIAGNDDGRNYYGLYFQDDWRTTPALTLNLGLRWEYFGQPYEHFNAQANFLPGTPSSEAQFLIPAGRVNALSELSPSFLQTLHTDEIALRFDGNRALSVSQDTNFAPRFGFAYHLARPLVVRGGYGIFYGGIRENYLALDNYPFSFSFSFPEPDDAHPIVYPNGATATLEEGLSGITIEPQAVNAEGLSLKGRQYYWNTPHTQDANFWLEYELSPRTTFGLGYVGSFSRHLEVDSTTNNVTKLLPPYLNPQNYVAYPDFARGINFLTTDGNSYYHSLQAKLHRQFSRGFDFLATYTYSKVRSDAYDLLSPGGDYVGYRAPEIPGFGIQGDYRLADFDIRNAVHFSGSYDLPVGRGRRFFRNRGGFVNTLLGGWRTNWILTLEDGQPVSIPCTITAAAGVGCSALFMPGENPIAGLHNVNQYWNPKAFTNPIPATAIGQSNLAPLGGGAQVTGPGFHRFDWSLFKEFRTSDKTRLEFRAEFFNLTNHPNFSIANFAPLLNFTDATNFGKLTGTRDSPNDPREVQFALKFYF